MQILHNCGYNVAVKKSEPMGAASVQTDKVVNVRMTESEHTLLKAYCASLNRSMQDVLRDFALMEIQKHYSFCRIVRSLIEEHGVDQDPKAKKPCSGYFCYYRRHNEACKDGQIDLLFVPSLELREMVTEVSAYILDFDGSCIEAPDKTS